MRKELITYVQEQLGFVEKSFESAEKKGRDAGVAYIKGQRRAYEDVLAALKRGKVV